MELALTASADDESFWAEAHEQDQRETEQEQSVVLDEPQLLRDGIEQGGTEDRPGNGSHATEDDGGEQQRREDELVGVRLDRLADVHVDRPGRAGKRRADAEGEKLEGDRVDAHRARGELVLPDRDPGATDAAVVDPREEQHDRGDEEDVEEVVVALERQEHPEDGVWL